MCADQNVRNQDTAFWRLSKQDVNVPDTPSLPAPAYGGGNLDFITEGYNTGAGWNHIFNASLIASVRAGWNFTLFKRDNPASTNGELLNQRYGITGGDHTISGGFSQMNLTGYGALGIGGFNPVDRDSQNRQLSGDLTWIRSRHLRTYNLSFYAQDDWNISDRLTINLGLRYELSPPWVERYKTMGIFDVDTDPAAPRLVYATTDLARLVL